MEQAIQQSWDNRVFRGMGIGAFMLIIVLYAIGFYYIPWIAGAVLAVDLIAVGILSHKRRSLMQTFMEEE
jgi:hypothetical protein